MNPRVPRLGNRVPLVRLGTSLNSVDSSTGKLNESEEEEGPTEVVVDFQATIAQHEIATHAIVAFGPEDTEQIVRTIQLSTFLQLAVFTCIAISVQLNPSAREIFQASDIDPSQAWQLSFGTAFIGAMLIANKKRLSPFSSKNSSKLVPTITEVRDRDRDKDHDSSSPEPVSDQESVALEEGSLRQNAFHVVRRRAVVTTVSGSQTEPKQRPAPAGAPAPGLGIGIEPAPKPKLVTWKLLAWIVILLPACFTLALFDHAWYGTVVLCALTTASLVAILIRSSSRLTAHDVVLRMSDRSNTRIDTGARTAQFGNIASAFTMAVLMLVGVALVSAKVIDMGHFLVATVAFFVWIMAIHLDTVFIETVLKRAPMTSTPAVILESKAMTSYLFISMVSRGFSFD